eukprot:TRINITY_DN417667_c0_g1_i1.p2 TRINITY_DN417667_c0_g1~~TRINITY_DN417667_c0_g1_i1.p2  ORF type:complete len:105 (-),score=12.85 TRINITY_DN417667_c0_g1_i1:314-628(-)
MIGPFAPRSFKTPHPNTKLKAITYIIRPIDKFVVKSFSEGNVKNLKKKFADNIAKAEIWTMLPIRPSTSQNTINNTIHAKTKLCTQQELSVLYTEILASESTSR